MITKRRIKLELKAPSMARYQHRDRFYRKAGELGLPSRAAFKLEELLARFTLVGQVDRVVDLGCAPGGWLTILSRVVGISGRVVGIDLVACPRPGPNVITVAGDVGSPEVRGRAAEALGSAADLVTSDLAPKISGITDRDQARSRELIGATLDLGRELLKPGGAMIAKVFMGPGFEEVRTLFAQDFTRVEVVRTLATRPGSSELYLVARSFQKHN
ncbi:MAG: RlmE family RNA methyltransferase [Deltaproteobacteria bacterium]|nr:RlmE family RNA methyltransferase [Deltaproteobacteria bacterium]